MRRPGGCGLIVRNVGGGDPVRAALVAAAALLLAACQQPSDLQSKPSAPVVAPAPQDSIGGDTTSYGVKYFSPEAHEIGRKIGEGLFAACRSNLPAKAKFESCARFRMALAFDDSGAGDRQCSHNVIMDDYMSCLVVGNVVLDVLRRLKDDQPIHDAFWSDLKTMKQVLTRAIVVGGVENCEDSIGTPSAKSCVDNWLSSRLKLPAEMLERCPPSADDPNRGVCIGEAIVVEFMEERIPRLSAVST